MKTLMTDICASMLTLSTALIGLMTWSSAKHGKKNMTDEEVRDRYGLCCGICKYFVDENPGGRRYCNNPKALWYSTSIGYFGFCKDYVAKEVKE